MTLTTGQGPGRGHLRLSTFKGAEVGGESKTVTVAAEAGFAAPELCCHGNRGGIPRHPRHSPKMYFVHRVFTFQGCRRPRAESERVEHSAPGPAPRK